MAIVEERWRAWALSCGFYLEVLAGRIIPILYEIRVTARCLHLFLHSQRHGLLFDSAARTRLEKLKPGFPAAYDSLHPCPLGQFCISILGLTQLIDEISDSPQPCCFQDGFSKLRLFNPAFGWLQGHIIPYIHPYTPHCALINKSIFPCQLPC